LNNIHRSLSGDKGNQVQKVLKDVKLEAFDYFNCTLSSRRNNIILIFFLWIVLPFSTLSVGGLQS
jgi:hypothetical protein